MRPIKIKKPKVDPRKQREDTVRRSCRGFLADSWNLLHAGYINRAYMKLRMAQRVDEGKKNSSDIDILIREFNVFAQQSLARADDLYETGEFHDALQMYASLSLLHDIVAGPLATSRLRQARKDPELQSALREIAADGMYRRIESILWDDALIVCRCDDCGGEYVLDESDVEYIDTPIDGHVEEASADDFDSPIDGEVGEFQPVAYDYESEAFCAITASDADRVLLLPEDAQVKVAELLDEGIFRFGNTDVADRSKRVLAALLEQEGFSELLSRRRHERTTRRDLNLARNYAANNAFEEARQLYFKVLREDSDGEWGRLAEKEVRGILDKD